MKYEQVLLKVVAKSSTGFNWLG